MNKSWYVFYGHELNMSRDETLNTIFCEMIDNISLLAVYNGNAEIEEEPRKMSFEEIIVLR